MPRCPVCGGAVDLEKSVTAPFCGDRCRTIDLGRWLNESYALPEPPRNAGDDEEEDRPARDADEED